MDLKQLEYFVRVAELGSFTRAAIALDVAQPALSRQVRLLEVELHQTLLTRNGRGAVPTEAGKLLLAHGRGILHQVDRAREELGRVRGSLAGRVAVGLPSSLARVLTVPLTRAFRRQMPDATISISEGLSVAMQESLVNGRLDIAVLYNAQPSADVEIAPLMEEELLLVQLRAPDSQEDAGSVPISLKAVSQLPLVIPSRPNAIRMHIESEMANIGCRPASRWRLTACLPFWTWWRMERGAPCCHATRWPTRFALAHFRCAPFMSRCCAPRCRWLPVLCGRQH